MAKARYINGVIVLELTNAADACRHMFTLLKEIEKDMQTFSSQQQVATIEHSIVGTQVKQTHTVCAETLMSIIQTIDENEGHFLMGIAPSRASVKFIIEGLNEWEEWMQPYIEALEDKALAESLKSSFEQSRPARESVLAKALQMGVD